VEKDSRLLHRQHKSSYAVFLEPEQFHCFTCSLQQGDFIVEDHLAEECVAQLQGGRHGFVVGEEVLNPFSDATGRCVPPHDHVRRVIGESGIVEPHEDPRVLLDPYWIVMGKSLLPSNMGEKVRGLERLIIY
jgi:hypothetical protein